MVAAVAVTALAPAAVAQGATRTVSAGPPNKVAGTPADGDVNAFYRNTVTVRVGDRVRWLFNGFHTVTFPKKGERPPAFIAPDPNGTKVSGVNDAAGNPFWFNGQTRVVLSEEGALPQGTRRYDGSRLTSSGAPLTQGRPKPYTLRFTRRGTYAYYCTIHPGQRGKVRVVGKGRSIPSNRANRRAARREYAKDARRLIADAKFAGPAGNEVRLGNDTKRTAILRFFPASKSVPVGTTVKFAMPAQTTEVHTVSFGPEPYLTEISNGFLQPDPAVPSGPPTVFNPLIAFPSDIPSLPSPDGTNHGNGFVSTGVLDREAASPGGGEASITFNKAGTYDYVCLIHSNMKGQIVVG